jgi:molecular chaperone DnaJ
VIYTVKPGTQTDTKVRLKGKGVPSLRNKAVRGDHYVTLVVQVPTKLTSEQKELLEAFDRSLNGGTTEGNTEKGTADTSGPGHKKKGFKEKLNDLFE